jgi:hypothetical protein
MEKKELVHKITQLSCTYVAYKENGVLCVSRRKENENQMNDFEMISNEKDLQPECELATEHIVRIRNLLQADGNGKFQSTTNSQLSEIGSSSAMLYHFTKSDVFGIFKYLGINVYGLDTERFSYKGNTKIDFINILSPLIGDGKKLKSKKESTIKAKGHGSESIIP